MRWAAIALATTAIGLFYYWEARATGEKFYWRYDLEGYYDELGRAFAGGHLYLPAKPSPQLLALPNPYDPSVDWSLKRQDMVLFRGRYYLYFGAGPAVLAFTPWRLLTHHDLPENFALFLFCLGGFLFSCGALLRILDLAEARPGPILTAVLLLALGLCQGVPFLLNRAAVYEIAIGGGYFCISAAMFFLTRAMRARPAGPWYTAAGLMFGFAIACRPQLGLAGAIAFGVLAMLRTRRRELLYFAAPLALAGAVICVYNFARFGNPLEFGFRYQLAGLGQNRLGLSLHNLPIGLFFMLGCPPHFSLVFPWFRMMFSVPFGSEAYGFPPEFFIEPTVGALWGAPFLGFALFTPRGIAVEARAALRIAALSSAAVLLFLAFTHLQSHRYEIDFLPLAVLAALAAAAIRISRSAGLRKVALIAVLTVAVVFGGVMNLAFGFAGPYNDILKHRPRRFFTIARWFSPVADLRQLYNPEIETAFTARFASQPDGFKEPLVVIGKQTFRDFVYAEHQQSGLRVVSEADTSKAAVDLPVPAGPIKFRIVYTPGAGDLAVFANGAQILTHHIGVLVTAPAQVTVGENRADRYICGLRFTGTLDSVEKTVRDSGIRPPREMD
jgi:hypothetical protein